MSERVTIYTTNNTYKQDNINNRQYKQYAHKSVCVYNSRGVSVHKKHIHLLDYHDQAKVKTALSWRYVDKQTKTRYIITNGIATKLKTYIRLLKHNHTKYIQTNTILYVDNKNNTNSKYVIYECTKDQAQKIAYKQIIHK